ncbi:hypothetical protein EVAR_76553_1 [Eumeta japonica]|uniref:MADF domain-containing protein n=1 Tax=Eumeta variegata TaxID=151549 RepID=A0A4C1T4T5_EUMVA|nr:hypothetical protein EVAR_76553_1 [Eumeta japonica]
MSETTERHGVRDIMEEFINIYRNEPCFWKIKSTDYHHRDKKNAAYNKLIEQYRKLEPNANRDVVVKKFNALGTNYRKEKRNVEESTRSGAGTSEVYEPTLWYYELLKFLDENQGTLRFSRTNIDEIESSQESESALHSQDMHDNTSEIDSTSQQTSSRARPPKRKTTDATDLSNEVLHSVNEHFKRPLLKDDRFDIFGKNIAIKLRELPKQQRLIAEKIINETLFQAEMGNLTLPQKEFIYAAPIASPPPHHTQQYIRVTPTPSPPPHHTQQYTHATTIYELQQLINLESTPSPSTPIPDNQQEDDNISTSQYNNSDSQHSSEDITACSSISLGVWPALGASLMQGEREQKGMHPDSNEVKTVEEEIELAVYRISAETLIERQRSDEFCRRTVEALRRNGDASGKKKRTLPTSPQDNDPTGTKQRIQVNKKNKTQTGQQRSSSLSQGVLKPMLKNTRGRGGARRVLAEPLWLSGGRHLLAAPQAFGTSTNSSL